jgi:DNA-binding SARP family transcriptional activator
VDVSASPRVTLLDGFSARIGDREPPGARVHLPSSAQRLVAHLCLVRTSARTAIAGALWPEVTEQQAHANLRSTLWRLHKAAPGLVHASSEDVRLASGVSVDVRELSAWARRALFPDSDIAVLAVPPSALRGELLLGWYDDWVLLERERLRQLRMHALERVAARLADAGRHGDALEAAFAAVRAEPLRESAHRTLIHVHMAGGDPAEAHRVYERFRALLEHELGVVPTELMTRLLEDGRPCAAPPAEERRDRRVPVRARRR